MTAVTTLPAPACELGEGPCYDRAADCAWWPDILGKTLIEHRFSTGETLTHPLPRMASVVARVDDDRQMLAMEDGLYRRAVADGALTLLVPLEADDPATRSNDGRVHPSGRLWIGTMGREAQKGAGAIYWSDGAQIRTLFPALSIPNSICFSADGGTGYFCDSAQNTVWRVALDPATGLPTGEPDVFLTGEALPRGGVFDGSVVDAQGVLWNAAHGGGSVSGFAPDGSLVCSIPLPTGQPTCPCFVGPALDRMIVTSAWEGYDAAQRAADPQAGCTFEVEGEFAGVAGADFKV